MTYPNLKAEMARKGLKISDVAEAASVSLKTVYNWLNGDSCPSVPQAFAIRRELFPEHSTDYLFGKD